MARPRKTLLPLEIEAKQFLDQNKIPDQPLTARHAIAAAALCGLLSRSSGMIDERLLREFKVTAYEYADTFLKD